MAALLLMPALAAAWWTVWSLLRAFPGRWIQVWPAAAGVLAYGLVQWAFRRPMGLYVFGHELTHALAALLSGYRVKSLKVSARGGEVVTSDTNIFVALAPYCLPLYTLLVLAVFQLVRHYGRLDLPPPWLGFSVGFTLAFHAALTLHALRQRQPDLEHAGVLLSLVLILLSNCLVLVLVLKTLFPGWVSVRAFAGQWLSRCLLIFGEGADRLTGLLRSL